MIQIDRLSLPSGYSPKPGDLLRIKEITGDNGRWKFGMEVVVEGTTSAEEHVKEAMGWTDHQLEIHQRMGKILEAMNAMDINDLTRMQSEISRDQAIGPLIDPTAWRDRKFDEARMIKTVVQATIDFKKAVSGIGNFKVVT